MRTATDHTVNKENSVPLTKILYNSTVCISIEADEAIPYKTTSPFCEHYEHIPAQFKHKILKQRAVIRHELSTYERDYYARHHFVPTEEDSPHFKRLITRRNLANKIPSKLGDQAMM